MRIFITLCLLAWAAAPAAANPYVTLSYGVTQDSHDFNIWHSRQHRGRRHTFDAGGSAHDWALGVGLRCATLDYELTVFDQRSETFMAQNGHKTYLTQIETRGIQIMAWHSLAEHADWTLKGGAGLGYRDSRYVMRGMGTHIRTTDRAPLAMVGLRMERPVASHVTFFGDLRGTFRPPVRIASGGTLRAPLEHDSSGLSLHIGVQITLN
jgi:hypothetical protein